MSLSNDLTPVAERHATLWERLPLISIPLGIFIVGAVSVTGLAGWSLAVKTLGIILAIFFAIVSLRTRVVPAPEMILYIAWVTWALTGAFGVRSPVLFWQSWLTHFQIWGLLLIVSIYTGGRKTLSFNMGALLVGFSIVGVYSYVTGEYAEAEAAGMRLTGLVRQSNVFAWLMVLATVAMAYFWMAPARRRWLKFGVLTVGMAGAAVACIRTGSRAGLAGLMAFYPTWIWFCYRRKMLRRPRVFAVVVAGFLLGGFLFMAYLLQSPAAGRFLEIGEVLRGGRVGGVQIRISLFQQAWDLLLQHPLTGVGLNNFRVHSATAHMSHSEYASVSANTGLPGVIIYFSIFVVLWLRAGKIARYSDDSFAVNVARLIRAVLVVIMLMNLGHLNHYNKAAWILLGSFIGYTNVVWHDVRTRMALRAGVGSAGRVAGAGLAAGSPEAGPHLSPGR